MEIAGIKIDKSKLMSKAELIKLLKENGESDKALSYVREKYDNLFKNELVWLYPISDGKHMGTFIVPVREGFVSLPYNSADPEDYELLILEDAVLFDKDALQIFYDDFKSFSEDLLAALLDMKQ